MQAKTKTMCASVRGRRARVSVCVRVQGLRTRLCALVRVLVRVLVYACVHVRVQVLQGQGERVRRARSVATRQHRSANAEYNALLVALLGVLLLWLISSQHHRSTQRQEQRQLQRQTRSQKQQKQIRCFALVFVFAQPEQQRQVQMWSQELRLQCEQKPRPKQSRRSERMLSLLPHCRCPRLCWLAGVCARTGLSTRPGSLQPALCV